MSKTVAPYGSWKSPVTASLLASATTRLLDAFASADGFAFVTEMRPAERGRYALLRFNLATGAANDVTPAAHSARTLVHEYGGGASAALAPSLVVYANMADQRVYLTDGAGAAPRALTPESDCKLRYAGFVLDAQRGRVLCVREDHRGAGEAVNAIVALPLDAPEPHDGTVLASGADFYSSVAIDATGTTLAWVQWNHPNMPWDTTSLMVASVDALDAPKLVAGGNEESVMEPRFSPDGKLVFISDRTNWWNLYSYDVQSGVTTQLLDVASEIGGPAWTMGGSHYCFLDRTHIVIQLEHQLQVLDIETHTSPLPLPNASSFDYLSAVDATTVVCVAASATRTAALISVDVASGKATELLGKPTPIPLEDISAPEAITFPTTLGAVSHAYYYAPRNSKFVAPDGELPPLLVQSHGGPTASAHPTYNSVIQFWTTRGFAVVDVDYRGSTGYGRAYRMALRNQWGVVDWQDCEAAVRFLTNFGTVDPKRCAIDGRSAGGYTTLCALTFSKVFRCGTSLYGVSDLEALATDTHKFESRYLDTLVGKYPEAKETYVARSPIHHTDKLAVAMLFLQGLEDRIVPPNQAQMMFDAVKRKGLPCAIRLYEGEQHGFRQSANIEDALGSELFFYSRVLGFAPADELPQLTIENMD